MTKNAVEVDERAAMQARLDAEGETEDGDYRAWARWSGALADGRPLCECRALEAAYRATLPTQEG